jgi:hypothetical protein
MKTPNRLIFCCSLALAALVWAAPPALAEGRDDVTRLHLTDGGYFDARSPVSRKDGLIVFRTLDGQLASIQERDVSRMELIQARPAEKKQRTPSGPADAGKPARAEFSNEDLREEEPVADEAVFTNVDLPQVEEPAAAEETETGTEGAPQPGEPGGEVFTNEDLPEGGAPPEETGDDAEAGAAAEEEDEATTEEGAEAATGEEGAASDAEAAEGSSEDE